MSVGAWPITSNMDWCEENYVVVSFIAEFFNTLSSIPVALFALHGCLHVYRNSLGPMPLALHLIMFVVGVGSVLFHGTLTWQGQTADEIPMLLAITLYLYAILSIRGPLSVVVTLGFFSFMLFAVCLYFMADFLYFISCYVIVLIVQVVVSVRHIQDPRCGRGVRRLFITGATTYIGGSLCLWLPETILCGNRLHTQHSTVFQKLYLHAWFHLTSALGAYLWGVFICYARYDFLLRWGKGDKRQDGADYEDVVLQNQGGIASCYIPLPHVVLKIK
eukprot:PhF_6_TR37807/c0_g1_i1/m.56289/K04711/ACER3, YDC1; dihydroceramidase